MFGIDMNIATRLSEESVRVVNVLKEVDRTFAGSFFLTAMQSYCEKNDVDMTEFVKDLAEVTEQTEPLRKAGLM